MKRRSNYRIVALGIIVIFMGGVVWSALLGLGPETQPPPLQPSPEPTPTPPPPVPPEPPAERYDLIIAGGIVYDGTGAAPRQADIGIVGDRIKKIGDLTKAQAGKRIDAAGKAVSPGFIDVHSHTYEYGDPLTMAAVQQGITTQIGGVDGRHDGFISGGQSARPVKIGEALAEIEKRGTGVNQALFAGLGTIRAQVMGYRRGSPTADELEQMKGLLREAMNEGALGLSSGLDYEPDRFTTTGEIIELAKVVAGFGAVYATHTRGDYSDVRSGVQEALRIGRETGVAVGIQHFKFVGPAEWQRFDEVVGLLNDAVAAGQKLTIDLYSYQAPDFAARMTVTEALARVGGAAELVEINISPGDPALVGKSLSEAAGLKNLSADALAARLTAEGARATPELIRVEHILALLKLPYALTDSDGEAAPLLEEHQALRPGGAGAHPRSYGAYPRFLRLNREHNVMPLQELIRKMTGAAADFYGLKDRGYLREGAFADIVVFDPDTVREEADFTTPQEYPEGIAHVLINGQLAVEDSISHDVTPGRALLRGR